MIKSIAILDAINRELAVLADGRPIYRDAMPNDFERPSYFIALGETAITPDGAGIVQVRQPIRIQCIDEVGEHYEADTDRLSNMSDGVRELLLCGFIRVADRALHVEGVTVSRDLDVADVTATLHYWDTLPQGATAPPMDDVAITTTMEE